MKDLLFLTLRAWLPALALLLLAGPGAQASGRASLNVTGAPQVIMADGKSTTTLTATVRDSEGSLAPDGTTVRFTTTSGTLDKDTSETASGVARVVLTSAAAAATAQITATAFLSSAASSSTGTASVEFTSDRDIAFTTGDSRWIHVDCPEYLIYSADSKTLEAQGRHGSAHLQYKGLDVTGDALQLNLQSAVLLGRNVTLERAHHTLHAAEIRYDLSTNTGSAVVLGTGRSAALSVSVTGYGLQTAPQAAAEADASVQTNIYRFEDLSPSKVIVSARALSVNPSDRIQFRRAAIYSDGKKILSVPFHQMSLSSEELFGQQLLGFGSQGLFVNVPFYYNVSPHSTGTLYLRNSASTGADSTGLSTGNSYFAQHGQRPGLALDLEHQYSLGRGGTGMLSLTGLTRSEWSAHWNHTQRIDDATSSYLYVDYPSHRSLFASSSLTREFKGFSLSLAATGNRDPGTQGYAYSNDTVSAGVQTVPRALAGTPVNMTFGVSAQRGEVMQVTPTTGKTITPVSTQAMTVRFYTAPIRPDRNTSISDSLSIGQSWNASHQHAATLLGTLGATRTTSGHGNLALNYTYRYDPLLSQISTTRLTASNPLGAFYRGASTQRLSLNYTVTPRPRMSLVLVGGYGLPLHDNNLFADWNYRVNQDWGIDIAASWDHYAAASFHETDISLTRRVFGRDLVFTYSTNTKKLIFDLAASGL